MSVTMVLEPTLKFRSPTRGRGVCTLPLTDGSHAYGVSENSHAGCEPGWALAPCATTPTATIRASTPRNRIGRYPHRSGGAAAKPQPHEGYAAEGIQV